MTNQEIPMPTHLVVNPFTTAQDGSPDAQNMTLEYRPAGGYRLYDGAVPAVRIVATQSRKMSMTGTLKATEEKGVYLIRATRVGAHAYTWDGYALAWSMEALQECAESWTYGTVSVNHNGKSYGTIEASYFEDPYVMMRIRVNDELDGWIARNIGSGGVGVSIEADLVDADYSAMSIKKATGTGVAVVLYPELPACSAEEGCGIVQAVEASADEGAVPSNDDGGVAIEGNASLTDRENMKADIKAEGEKMSGKADVTVKVEAKESAELTAAIAEREKLAAKVAELEAANAALVAKEKEGILASIGPKVGEAVASYQDMKVCELRLVAKAIADYEAVMERVPEVSSGAEGEAIKATEDPVPGEAEKEKLAATLKEVEGRLGIKLTE